MKKLQKEQNFGKICKSGIGLMGFLLALITGGGEVMAQPSQQPPQGVVNAKFNSVGTNAIKTFNGTNDLITLTANLITALQSVSVLGNFSVGLAGAPVFSLNSATKIANIVAQISNSSTNNYPENAVRFNDNEGVYSSSELANVGAFHGVSSGGYGVFGQGGGGGGYFRNNDNTNTVLLANNSNAISAKTTNSALTNVTVDVATINGAGVSSIASGGGVGVFGQSKNGKGVEAVSTNGTALVAVGGGGNGSNSKAGEFRRPGNNNNVNRVDLVTSNYSIDSYGPIKVQSGGVEVIGNSSFNGNLNVNGGVTTTGGVNVNGKVTAKGGIDVIGNSSFNGNLNVNGGVTTTGGVNVNGKVTAKGGIDVIGNSSFNGGVGINGQNGTLSVAQSAQIGGGLSVTGRITAGGGIGRLVGAYSSSSVTIAPSESKVLDVSCPKLTDIMVICTYNEINTNTNLLVPQDIWVQTFGLKSGGGGKTVTGTLPASSWGGAQQISAQINNINTYDIPHRCSIRVKNFSNSNNSDVKAKAIAYCFDPSL